MAYHKDYKDFLKKLREFGVVHIKESKDTRKIEELQSLLAIRKEINTLISRVKSRRSKNAPAIVPHDIQSVEEAKVAREAIEELFDKELMLKNQIDASRKEIDYWKIWGEYNVNDFSKLEKDGYPVRFFVAPTSSYKEEWEERYGAVLINSFRAHNYFVTVGKLPDNGPEAEEVKPPKHTVAELEERALIIEEAYEKVQKEITEFADNKIGVLKGYVNYLDKDYAFTNALLQASDEADAALKVVEGFIPEKHAHEVETALQSEPIYMENIPIEVDEKVPVKLKNNAYAKLFEPITKMYSLPNYGELDITAMFAPFFMLFFAMCFGDGGYGILLFVVSTYIKMASKKKDNGMRGILSMLQWLGGTAAVVGSLMGSVFGMVMPWANDGSLLGSVRNDYFLNQDNLMYISVIIGIIQIIFGKFVAGVKVTKQKGFKHALATYAWGVIILAGGLGLAFYFLMKDTVPVTVSYALFGVAVAAYLVALFYNMPGKNPLINLGAGLWNTYNAASGLLGDSLSYIRLFAIGLTGGILGGVFNNLAVDAASSMPIGVNFIVMTIILLLGHGLNIGLCMISSFVHPLRLTFVEFYKNAEFEGSGTIYKPLR